MSTKRSARLFLLAVVAVSLRAPNSLADPLNEAKKALNHAKDALENAKHELAHANDVYNGAVTKVAVSEHDVTHAAHSMNSAKNLADIRHAKVLTAQQIAVGLGNLTKQLKGTLAKAEANEQKALDDLLSRNIVLYDMGWRVNIEYDLKTQGFNAWAEFPHGMQLTTGEIASVLNGKPALPEIEPLELLTACLGLDVDRQCDYDDVVRQAYRGIAPTDRVYVSTRGLSELLTPEHAGSAAVDAVVSGGSTIEGTANELVAACRRELNSVNAFLRDTAKDEADNALPRLAEAIASGQPFESPKLTIKPLHAHMKYTARLAGASELLNFLPGLKRKNGELGSTSSPRPGFIVVVKNVAQPLSAKDFAAQIGTAHLPAAFLQQLPAGTVPLFSTAQLDPDDPFTAVAASLATAFKNLDYGQLKPIDPADPVFLDLRATPIGKTLNALVGNLKVGNAGDPPTISKLSLNLHTGQVSATVNLSAKAKVKLADAIRIVGKTFHDIDASFLKDWQNASAEVANLSKELSDATAKLAPANADVKNAIDALNGANHALDLAKASYQHALAVLNSATAAQANAGHDVAVAKNNVKQAEDTVKHFTDLVGHLQLPPARHIHWPHW